MPNSQEKPSPSPSATVIGALQGTTAPRLSDCAVVERQSSAGTSATGPRPRNANPAAPSPASAPPRPRPASHRVVLHQLRAQDPHRLGGLLALLPGPRRLHLGRCRQAGRDRGCGWARRSLGRAPPRASSAAGGGCSCGSLGTGGP